MRTANITGPHQNFWPHDMVWSSPMFVNSGVQSNEEYEGAPKNVGSQFWKLQKHVYPIR